MIRTSPFHERTSVLNTTGLWEHWSGTLATTRYQMSEKFEYFAIRNAAGIFDSSPLYKYRFTGPDAERFLAGVLARDIRTCDVGHAQYTAWLDDRGFVVEDGVILRLGPSEFLLTAAEPNLAYFEELVGRDKVTIADETDDWAVLAVQGPRSRALLAELAPAVADLPYFGLTNATLAKVPVIVSRTGYTGDLGYEVWVPAKEALKVWDAVAATGEAKSVIPFGMTALYMARIEAGLLLLDVDFHSSRFAWTDDERTTLLELGLGWMVRDLATTDRVFIGRDALRREQAARSSRWRMTGLILDWREFDRIHDEAGLIPPKDHTPIQDEYYLYDEHGAQLGWASSQMYSPMLQRHIALGRVPLEYAKPGCRVKLELPVSHKYEYFDAVVTRTPLYDPERRTA